MSVKVKFKIGIKKNINTIFNVENKEPIKTIFRINAGTAAFSSLLGSPYDNTALAAALDLKADKTAVTEQIETVTDLINSTSTTLDNKIDTVQSDLSGDISTLSETVADNFNTLLGNIQNEAATRAENDTTLQGNIATLNETVSNNYSDLNGKITLINGEISDLSIRIGDNYTDLSGQISDLSATIESYNTATNGRIDLLSQTVSTNDTAINNKVDGINTTLTNSLNSLSNTVLSNYTTLDTKIDNIKSTIDSDISDLSDTVNQNYTDLSDAITNTASTINSRINSEVQTLNTAINTENTQRQAADINLQSQIDAITSASDVFDIVGTYAELEAYDISTVPTNDIIKVLVDNTHNNAATYYRCVENAGIKTWVYVGAEGAYYTKGEADNKFVDKSTTINNKPLSNNITLTASDVNALPADTIIGAGIITLQKNGVDFDSFNVNATANKSINIIVPTDTADLTNGAEFITAASLPTVNNGTLDIQVNGTSIGTFTANQSGNTTANIVVPDSATWGNITGTISNQTDLINLLNSKYDASNPAGFITGINESDVVSALGFTPYNSTNPAGYITATALNGYATQTWVQNQNYITSSDLIDYVTNSTLATTLTDYVTNSTLTVTLADYALLSDIPTVPTTDQTYNSTSNNPQSGTAVAEAIESVVTPIATSSTVGKVKPDNTTTKVDANGILSAISRNVGEIVQSTLPLTDAGLHLLDGSVIDGTGIYAEFYQYIADLYNDTKVYNPSAFTVVGSPTITADGIASGFSSSNYLRLPNSILANIFPKKKWKIQTGVVTITNQTTSRGILFISGHYSCILQIHTNRYLYLSMSSNGSTFDIANDKISSRQYEYNKPYIFTLERDENGYFVKMFDINANQEYTILTISSTADIYVDSDTNFPKIGYDSWYSAIGDTSIDLKQFSITVDGVEVFSGSKPANYFTDETTWQNSVTTYGSCGKFVYDSTLNTVRLPKVSDILQGTTDLTALGNLIEAGLPDIIGTFGANFSQGNFFNTGTGAFGSYRDNNTNTTVPTDSSDQMPNNNMWDFYASRSSSIYGNSSTVQPQTIKVLLYIVIATSSKTDIQVDIDNIATDLNGKADNDLSNVTDTAKVMISGMGMPSNRYLDITLGASGTTYTAPANGWFIIQKRTNASTSQYLRMSNITNDFSQEENATVSSNNLSLYMPVKNGDTIYINYNAGGNTDLFRFYYAQGSESEAQ